MEHSFKNLVSVGYAIIFLCGTAKAFGYGLANETTKERDKAHMKSEVQMDPEKLLLSHLLNGYNNASRPAKNYSNALVVTLGVALVQIISLDEKNQILTSNCWISLIWLDHKLSWDSDKFSNITSLLVPAWMIWRPDILLYNNAVLHHFYGLRLHSADLDYYHKMIQSNVILQSNGNVTWLFTSIIRSTCEIDVRFFPFDKQTCVMKFASWTFDGFKLDLVVITESGDTSNYITSTEWQLRNFTAKRNIVYYSCCAEPYPDITMSISIQRRPFFYVYNHLIPCGVATLFAFLGFYAPGESGEKVTIGITTLLSVTLFMLMVGEVMPPTASSLPLISFYYGLCMLIIGLATAVQVFTLNIHHRGARGREPPRPVKRLVGIIGQILLVRGRTSVLKHSIRRRQYKPIKIALAGSADNRNQTAKTDPRRKSKKGPALASPEISLEDDTSKGHVARFLANRLSSTLAQVCLLIDINESRYETKVTFDKNSSDWTDIAHILDKLLLVIFLVGTLTLTLYVFVDVPYFWEHS